jgi:hypothetical protein
MIITSPQPRANTKATSIEDAISLFQKAASAANRGDEAGVEDVLLRLEQATQVMPNIQYDPNTLRLTAHVNAIMNETEAPRNYEGVCDLAKQVQEYAFNDEGLVRVVAQISVGHLLRQMHEALEKGDAYENSQFDEYAGGIRDIVDKAGFPEEKRQLFESNIARLAYENSMNNLKLCMNEACRESRLGKTTSMLPKIQEQMQRASEAGKPIRMTVDTQIVCRNLSAWICADLAAVRPGEVLEEDITDRIRGDYDAASGYAKKAGLDSSEKCKFDELLQEVMQKVERTLYSGVVMFAKPGSSLFERAYANYEKFYKDFFKVLGETEQDVNETRESLWKIYRGQNE